MAIDQEQLRQKIEEIFPEIKAGGMELTVEFDSEKNAWAVDLVKGSHHLKTFLEPDEVATCMIGEKCLSLGMQIGQLEHNIESV